MQTGFPTAATSALIQWAAQLSTSSAAGTSALFSSLILGRPWDQP